MPYQFDHWEIFDDFYFDYLFSKEKNKKKKKIRKKVHYSNFVTVIIIPDVEINTVPDQGLQAK